MVAIRDKSPSQSQNLTLALELAAAGFAVFPCRESGDDIKAPYTSNGFHDATTDGEQLRKWWKRWPGALVGLPTGEVNNLAVLDLDRKNGKDGVAELWDRALLPRSSVVVVSPSGGQHLYFDYSEGLESSHGKVGPGVDIQADGVYVIAPGSVLPDDRAYKYERGNLLESELPAWPEDTEFQPRSRDYANDNGNDGPTSLPPEVFADITMSIPNDDVEYDEYFKMCASIHHELGDEGLPLCIRWSAQSEKHNERFLRRNIWRHLGKRDDGPLITGWHIIHMARGEWAITSQEAEYLFDDLPPKPREHFQLDENGVIRAFTAKYKNELRFDHTVGCWFRFDGNAWRLERTKLAQYLVREVSVTMSKGDLKAKPLRKVASWEASERGARTAREFAVNSDQWDRDKMLLGTPGGTVELSSGELRLANPDDQISRLTAVAPIPLHQFDPDRDCPRWLNFLDGALNGDAKAIRFLQQWGGYSLTGETREHALLFVYGPGGSGKSTAINTMAEIMGEYAINVATSTLTAKKHDAHPEEMARLDGPRFAHASETEKGSRWAENRIKELTGGDQITARFMRQNSFTFTPQFKLTIVGNNAPALDDVDEAIKRRFNILPFDHPPKRKDENLPNKLREEWPGILSWLIAGCLDWQKDGLVQPGVVRRATEGYFADQDIVQQWIDEQCEVGPDNADTTARLWESYRDHARQNGVEPGSKINFTRDTLQKRGFTSIKNTHGIRGRGFLGIRVGTDNDLW